MDTRTNEIYYLGEHDTTRTVIGDDGKIYNVIDGENCINYCALANKRNCYIRAVFGRAKCHDFVPAKRNV